MANIYGNDSSNTLNGTSSNDRLYGFGGNDVLNAGAMNDVLFGGNGDDTLVGGTGIDWLQGATGGSGTTAHVDVDVLMGGQDYDTDYFVLGRDSTSFYTNSGYAILKEFSVNQDWVVIANSISLDRINITYGNVVGGSAGDTILSLDNNIIGIVQDQDLRGYNKDYYITQSQYVMNPGV